jgi:hypothetical protein
MPEVPVTEKLPVAAKQHIDLTSRNSSIMILIGAGLFFFGIGIILSLFPQTVELGTKVLVMAAGAWSTLLLALNLDSHTPTPPGPTAVGA